MRHGINAEGVAPGTVKGKKNAALLTELLFEPFFCGSTKLVISISQSMSLINMCNGFHNL